METVRNILEKYRDKPFDVIIFSDDNFIHFDCRDLSKFDLDNVAKTSYDHEVLEMPVKSWYLDAKEIRILV